MKQFINQFGETVTVFDKAELLAFENLAVWRELVRRAKSKTNTLFLNYKNISAVPGNMSASAFGYEVGHNTGVIEGIEELLNELKNCEDATNAEETPSGAPGQPDTATP